MYWDQVLKEVLNKKNVNYPSVFTNIKKPLQVEEPRPCFYRPSKEDEFRIYLGVSRPGVYFTRRECQCVFLLLEGKTMKESGSALNLSPRTVEYYVKNMKAKARVRTRSELIKIILSSEFMHNIEKAGWPVQQKLLTKNSQVFKQPSKESLF